MKDLILSAGLITILWLLPMLVSAEICRERNRTIVKGIIVTGLFLHAAWLATFLLWLALKTRNAETKTLS